ncbi:unnamed protein product [Aureobasidium mustum]|uniref:Uncharacterized protein n=1 Tax=Aureobasidium mustum TaxID=2773714 RepID=A0A9N8PKB4_9PEZI|nr:unnamed protein product [Aureobasidium mustum]
MSDNKGIHLLLLEVYGKLTKCKGALGGLTDTVGKTGKGLTDTVGNTVQGVGKGASDTVGSATKGVGDTTKGMFASKRSIAKSQQLIKKQDLEMVLRALLEEVQAVVHLLVVVTLTTLAYKGGYHVVMKSMNTS